MIEPFDGGSGSSRLRHVIKQIGYNKDVDIEFATITAPLPDLRFQVDNVKIEFDAYDAVVAEHLREHKREAVINGQDVEITFKDALKVGDRVAVAMYNDNQAYFIIDRI